MADEPEIPNPATAAPAAAIVEAPKPETPKAEAPKSAAKSELAEAPKKKKRPGVAPRRGKKLRNVIRNVEKKVAEAGTLPVKQAVTLLKQIKRAKFDETVEIHINLGIDPTKQGDTIYNGALDNAAGVAVMLEVARVGSRSALVDARSQIKK